MRIKKRMTRQEEFEVMKMVLDKFLWFGMVILAFGFYKIIFSRPQDLWFSLSVLVAGAILLVLFMILVLRHYEYSK